MPKKKGTKGGNPNPVRTPEFLANQKKAEDMPEGVKLSQKPVAVKLTEEITKAVNALGSKKSLWLRRVISDAAQRELMGGENSTS